MLCDGLFGGIRIISVATIIILYCCDKDNDNDIYNDNSQRLANSADDKHQGPSCC
jgi:hypothetical protein